jgi:hypothetical protein
MTSRFLRGALLLALGLTFSLFRETRKHPDGKPAPPFETHRPARAVEEERTQGPSMLAARPRDRRFDRR